MENVLNYFFDASDKVLSNAMNIRGNYPNHFINEKNDSIELELSLPGFIRDELNIEIDNDTLNVYTNESFEDNMWKNSFRKKFKLSNHLNYKKINAKLENGILNISIPKTDKAKKLNINIQ